jgi:ribosome-interacting GTPase 1
MNFMARMRREDEEPQAASSGSHGFAVECRGMSYFRHIGAFSRTQLFQVGAHQQDEGVLQFFRA